jgi:type II secretory pathway pseudopilin PulG
MAMHKNLRQLQQRGQGTLIGLLVTMAIIVILAAWLYPRYMKPGGVDGSVASPEQDAQDVACGTYYQQIGEAIVSYKDSHGTVPPNLQALRSEGVTPDMYNDPDCKFQYNPQTGMLGDKDVPVPPPAPSATAGTPGSPSSSPTASPPPVSNAPNTDIYSKAAHAGGSGDVPGDLVNGN